MTTKNPKVFISHSHNDVHCATALKKVLEKHFVKVFLDQEQIMPGDPLPERIIKGIKWCDEFLLIWSRNAANSSWVEKEWDLAYDLRKKIIPYCLDATRLPEELEDRVYVERGDEKHSHAKLLQSIFGIDYEPPTGRELFPGKWRTKLSTAEGQATYDIELRANGQISGTGKIDQTGFMGMLGDILRYEGVMNPLTSPIIFTGNWSYDNEGEMLTLDLTSRMFGQSNHQSIFVHATGYEKGAIRGKDSQGASWTLRRLTQPPATRKAKKTTQLVNDDEYVLCEICRARVKEINLNRHMRKVHDDEI